MPTDELSRALDVEVDVHLDAARFDRIWRSARRRRTRRRVAGLTAGVVVVGVALLWSPILPAPSPIPIVNEPAQEADEAITTVPDLGGPVEVGEATARLRELGFDVEVRGDHDPAAQVWGTEPPPFAPVVPGATIVVVSFPEGGISAGEFDPPEWTPVAGLGDVAGYAHREDLYPELYVGGLPHPDEIREMIERGEIENGVIPSDPIPVRTLDGELVGWLDEEFVPVDARTHAPDGG